MDSDKPLVISRFLLRVWITVLPSRRAYYTRYSVIVKSEPHEPRAALISVS